MTVRVLIKPAGESAYIDYSYYLRGDGIGTINNRVNTGLTHIDSGDVKLVFGNIGGIFDELFSAADLLDDIWVKLYAEGASEAFFTGLAVNSSVVFDDEKKRCSFNVFSSSKHYWEQLDCNIDPGYDWGSETTKKLTDSGTWCYDIIEVVKLLINHHTGIAEENISIDSLLNAQGFLNIGDVESNTGIRYRAFRDRVGAFSYNAGSSTALIARDGQNNHEFLRSGDSLYVYDGENELLITVEMRTATTSNIVLSFEEAISETLSFDPESAYCDYLPSENMHAKTLLRYAERALAGVIRFDENSASFDSVYTLLGRAPMNLDLMNPKKSSRRKLFNLEDRKYGVAVRREVPDEPIYRSYKYIDGGPVDSIAPNNIVDASKSWEVNVHKGKYLFCKNGLSSNYDSLLAILEIAFNGSDIIYAGPVPAGTTHYAVMEKNIDYIPQDYYAYIGQSWPTSVDFYKMALPYSTLQEEMPYIFVEPWIDPTTYKSYNYPPLVILMIMLYLAWYVYTRGVRASMKVEVDYDPALEPLRLGVLDGVNYIIMVTDTRMKKERMTLQLTEYWI